MDSSDLSEDNSRFFCYYSFASQPHALMYLNPLKIESVVFDCRSAMSVTYITIEVLLKYFLW